ncbi:peptidylprolyl isomerase [Leptolyngbya sp. FACHB-541]|uniref:peptidylprolyl isomerase n=1 Tax=Leptolyngbya sp. FACHB-541 TaxID=2692810 RepID=UPI001685CB4F|nr:peptidylprolyl isomerase [Leptolyngbya sp. FACHB-541]MBD2000295.1 peptidylprolyl isomerase [Leptolyngbya sp. FACHB-541]
MTAVLQIGYSTLTSENIVPLLACYQIIPQLICESIIEQAIKTIHCTSEETTQACQELYQQWGLISESQRQTWRSHYRLSQEQFEKLATRKLRIEKFKRLSWGHTVGSCFLKRKMQLDQVVYSFMRVSDRGLANELYFRIQEGEQSFAELAREYSEGPEAYTSGLMGPVELGKLHPNLAELLYTSPVNKVQSPVPFGEWQVIVRVEKFIPAELDDAMRQRLLQEKFESWFQEQLRQLPYQERIWMGVTSDNPNDATKNLAVA